MPAGRAIRAGRAFVELFADDKRLRSGLDRAKARMLAFVRVASPVAAAIAAVGTAAVTAAVTGAVKLANDFAAAGDQFDKLSKRTGIAVETLSALKFAAEQSGTNIDQLGQALFRMTRRIANAALGTGPAVRALKELGINAAEISRLSTEEEFLRIVGALEGIADEGKRAQFAFEIFGDNARQLIPLLAEGEGGIRKLVQEARDLGAVMSEEDARAAAELTDAMNRMKTALRGLALTIGAAVAPAITEAANQLTELIKRVIVLGQTMRQTFVLTSLNAMRILTTELKKFAVELGRISGEIVLDFGEFLGLPRIAQKRKDLEESIRKSLEQIDFQDRMQKSLIELFRTQLGPGLDKLPQVLDQLGGAGAGGPGIQGTFSADPRQFGGPTVSLRNISVSLDTLVTEVRAVKRAVDDGLALA